MFTTKPGLDVEQLRHFARDITEPVDLEALVRDGVLGRHGKWFKLLKPDDLPAGLNRRIHKLKCTKDGLLVRFKAPNKKLLKIAKAFLDG